MDKKIKILKINENKKFSEIEKMIIDFQNLIPDINLIDNYNHRTVRIEMIIKEIWNDFVLNKNRNKEDAKCPSLGLNKIEVKTKNYKKLASEESMIKSKFMFDKQDRESRREYILKFDALIFGIFVKEKLHWLAWTKNDLVLQEYRNLCIDKQNLFLKYWEEKQKRRDQNGGNDAITISLNDFSENTIWNFFYDGKIYLDITLKEIKSILINKKI